MIHLQNFDIQNSFSALIYSQDISTQTKDGFVVKLIDSSFLSTQMCCVFAWFVLNAAAIEDADISLSMIEVH